MAMPSLRGAPAYARPPRHVDVIERPLDPDDLPLEALRNDDEQRLAAAIADGTATAAELHDADPGHPGHTLQPSESGGLKSIASRLRRPRA
jgi:hypothetical protein